MEHLQSLSAYTAMVIELDFYDNQKQEWYIKVRYCIYWENMPFIPSSVPKLPLSMETSRGKMMKSDNPAPDSLGVDIQHDLKWNTHINRITASANKTLGLFGEIWDHVTKPPRKLPMSP